MPSTPKQITVAEGATLNIEAANTSKLLIVKNNSKIAMADKSSANNVKVINSEKAEMTIAGSLEFAAGSENMGTITVAATGELQGTTVGHITNKGLIKNLGKIWNMVNADVETAIVETSAFVNHFKSNGAEATIKLIGLKDPVSGITGAGAGHLLYSGANVNLDAANTFGVTDLIVSGYLYVTGSTTATVKIITVEEATIIEGGSFTGSAWTASAQKLNVASGAVINISADVKMSFLNAGTYKADVNVLKGSLSIVEDNVAAIDDLTLGSKEAFTEIGATVNIAKASILTIAGVLSRNADLKTVKPVINNNGTATAGDITGIAGKITVNGNEVTKVP